MTNQFKPSDFSSYAEYEKHAVALERAQTLNFRLFEIWNDCMELVQPDTNLYCNLLAVLDESVQLGYEAAIGKPHKASDYSVSEETIGGHDNACWFCNNNVERIGDRDCMLRECKFEVKEYID